MPGMPDGTYTLDHIEYNQGFVSDYWKTVKKFGG
jgi:hypothetical protein